MEISENGIDSQLDSNSIRTRSSEDRKTSYREMLSIVEDIEEKNDLDLQAVTDIGKILRKINDLEKEYPIEQRVDQTNETLLDCMVLSNSSSILVKCMKAVDISTTTYEPTDFCDRLCEHLKDEDGDFRTSDLLKLLNEARKVIPQINPYEYVYGSFDFNKIPEPKVRKPVNTNPKEKFTKKEPEKVLDINKDEDGIDEIVKVLYNVLLEEYKKHREQPISYYEYVMDTDFSKTVENMFYCSFLIRDGKARIDLDGKNPTITPIIKRELKEFRAQGGVNSQMITSLSMDDWERSKREGFLQKHMRKSK